MIDTNSSLLEKMSRMSIEKMLALPEERLHLLREKASERIGRAGLIYDWIEGVIALKRRSRACWSIARLEDNFSDIFSQERHVRAHRFTDGSTQ